MTTSFQDYVALHEKRHLQDLEAAGDREGVNALVALRNLTAEVWGKVEQIDQDKRLTAEAKSSDKTEARAAYEKELESWTEKFLAPLPEQRRAELERLKGERQGDPTTEERASQREIRELVFSLERDPLKLRASMDSFPEAVKRALENAPPLPQRSADGRLTFAEIVPVDNLSSPALEYMKAVEQKLTILRNTARKMVIDRVTG